MPVPSLFSLCGKSVEDTLVKIGNNFLSSEDISFDDYSKQLEEFTRELFSTPVSRRSELAEHCLIAANSLTVDHDLSAADTEVDSRNQFVIQRLVAMASLCKLRKLDFGRFEPLEESLLSFLWRMTNLEDLTWCAGEEEPRLMKSLPFLTSLKKFTSDYCTDEIIAAICENCEHLEVVKIKYKCEVTDRSIDSLIQCKNLERVKLNGVGVTEAGILKLLAKSQSKNLKRVNKEFSFSSNFLSLLEAEVVPFRTLPLTRFRGRDFSAEHLPLISKFFPHLECLFVDYEELAKLPDFSCLDCLEKLKIFKMNICCLPKPIKQLYLLKSQYLTLLGISFDSQISISGLIQIGVHCPNLISLDLCKCLLIKDVDDRTAWAFSKPFQKLESFSFTSNSSVWGLELILRHATAIEIISLIASSGLTDAFLMSIMKFNDFKELKYLEIGHGDNISVKLLKSLIANCKKLGWFNFALLDGASDHKFECLRNFITENEYSVRLF